MYNAPEPQDLRWHQISGTKGIGRIHMLNDRRRLVVEKGSAVSIWDVIKCVKIAEFEEGEDFDGVVKREQTREWVANWCGVEKKGAVRCPVGNWIFRRPADDICRQFLCI